tara:strand:+ start:397 stop:894 length:498 start_codon:yes stop_codon:yes gene_type:complete
MLDFIKKYIYLVNKYNIVEIILGKRVSESIFKTDLTEEAITNIISNLKQRYIKIKTVNYTNQIRSRGCELIELINKNFTHTYISINEYFMSKSFIIQNKILSVDKTVIPSYTEYDREETLEILDMIVHNIIIRVEKGDHYKLKIIINKPCKVEKLQEILNVINYS